MKTAGLGLGQLLVAALCLACSSAKKEAATSLAKNPVQPFIQDMRQLTFEGTRAGEGYFSHDGRFLIFQSEREKSNPFYQIYLMDRQTGVTHRVSPGMGKTTCAWIHPSNKKVIFASTHADKNLKQKAEQEWAERKAPKKRYNWNFDETYDIYEADIKGKGLKNLTRTLGYDAEASYSPDGQWIAFASNRAAYQKGGLSQEQAAIFARDPSYMMDLYIMRADGTGVKQLTNHLGYDGGPFFSPDGRRLTFRRFTPDGKTAEIFTINTDGSDERQITKMGNMSWAPFYHPSGDYLIFASNKEGYANFELYIVDTAGTKTPVRVTDIAGFDGLPVFAPSGDELVWTHSGENGVAQLYSARWDNALARTALGLAKRLPDTKVLAPATEASNAEKWVEYLASEQFEGRPTGGAKEREYLQTIAKYFEDLGLKPGVGKSFLQDYEFASGVELSGENVLNLNILAASGKAEIGKDWIPLSYSKTGSFRAAPVVFAGYGIVAPSSDKQAAYNSYEGLDVKDKWVLAFAGLPDDVPNERRFHLHLYSRLQHKAMMARQNGARGLILIEDSATPAQPLQLGFDGRGEDAGLPVLRLSAELADQIFAAQGTTRKAWTEKLAKGELLSLPLTGISADAVIGLTTVTSQSANLLARIDAKARNTVVVGAHIDHLGRGQGGNSLSKIKDAIHFGADDNASGVAGVLEIAKSMMAKIKSGEFKPKQNIVFALWTGEEIGILGSSHFARNNKEKVTAYLNMDMIGRLRDSLIIQGTGSATQWPGLVERVSSRQPVKISTQADPYLPTDALAFYLKKIPVLSAFTGSHSEYHTGGDTPGLINYAGLAKSAAWIEDMAQTLASASQPLVTYQATEGGRSQESGRGFRLYLGTIPDYSQTSKSGVLISGTNKGSPAEKAGLESGDVIVELGGMKIQNLQDYVYCLQALKAGQQIKMRVLRAGSERELEITPALKTQQ